MFKVNLRFKIFFGYTILAFFLFILAGGNIYLVNQIVGDHEKAVAKMKETRMLKEMETAHLTWQSSLKDSLLTGKTFSGVLDHTKCTLGSWYYDYLKSAEFRDQPPHVSKLYQDLEEPHRKIHQIAEEINLLITSSTSERQRAVEIYHLQMVPQMNSVYKILSDITGYNTEQAALHEKNANDQQNNVLYMSMILLTAALTLGGGTSYLLSLNIAKPIKEAVQTIAATSAEIAVSMEQHERNALLQASSVAEVSATMDELRVSSEQSSQQANKIAETARGAAQSVSIGLSTLEEMVSAMEDMKVKVNSIAQQILNLSDQVGQIGSITVSVKDLADQTNMLALNAAVEAVRAGENGKGFAIVAAEIRKLADLSKKASERIGNIVLDVQKSTNTTVMVTEEGTKTVQSTEKLTQRTEEMFHELKQTIVDISHYIQQVSLNIQQQAGAVSGVNSAMADINRATKEQAAGISQTKIGMENLNHAGVTLREMV